MRRILGLTLVMLTILVSVAMSAPTTFLAQGTLLTGSLPLSGTHSATFSLYDAQTGGSAFWTEDQSITVNNGLYTAQLGSVAALPMSHFTGQMTWLEVTLDGTTLTTRLPFQPYAISAINIPMVDLVVTGSIKVQVQPGVNNSGFSFMTAPEQSSMIMTASDGSQRMVMRSTFEANYLNDALRISTIGFGNALTVMGNGNVSTGRDLDVAGNLKTPNSLYLGNSKAVYFDDGAGTGSVPVVSYSNVGNTTIMGGNSIYFSLINGGGTVLSVDHRGIVTITGDLIVSRSKCRVVVTAYGKLKMNAVESAHAIFMDEESSARLVDGKCRINLSPKFLSTVTVNEKYKLAVNVTIYGPHGSGWYVERDDTGFTVIDPAGGDNEFSWQVIARQQGYENTYLDPVDQTAQK